VWTRLTPDLRPTADILPLEAAKQHLYRTDTDEDVLIRALIDAAIAHVEGPDGIGLWLADQRWRLSLDAFPCGAIALPGQPVRGIHAVTYVDPAGVTQTLDPAAYVFDGERYPAIVDPVTGTSWPATRLQSGAVKVTFTCGHADPLHVPRPVIQALKLLVGHWFINREAGSTAKLAEVPFSVSALLSRYGTRF
jgi:uncharacterized phiE125 gp8 family phage protein